MRDGIELAVTNMQAGVIDCLWIQNNFISGCVLYTAYEHLINIVQTNNYIFEITKIQKQNYYKLFYFYKMFGQLIKLQNMKDNYSNWI